MRAMKYVFIFLAVVLTLGSCRKIEHLSPVPFIEYINFTVFDTVDILGNQGKAGRLKFRFEDGDGDVGLREPFGFLPDTTNMFITLYRKIEGEMQISTDKYDPLLPSSSYRIPYMERLGRNKILKGTIAVIFLYQDYAAGDTIKYEFYIKDRAHNDSNMASTSEIIVSLNGTYPE